MAKAHDDFAFFIEWKFAKMFDNFMFIHGGNLLR